MHKDPEGVRTGEEVACEWVRGGHARSELCEEVRNLLLESIKNRQLHKLNIGLLIYRQQTHHPTHHTWTGLNFLRTGS